MGLCPPPALQGGARRGLAQVNKKAPSGERGLRVQATLISQKRGERFCRTWHLTRAAVRRSAVDCGGQVAGASSGRVPPPTLDKSGALILLGIGFVFKYSQDVACVQNSGNKVVEAAESSPHHLPHHPWPEEPGGEISRLGPLPRALPCDPPGPRRTSPLLSPGAFRSLCSR